MININLLPGVSKNTARQVEINHDASPGHLDHCQICGSDDLRLIIDLGHQPLCDALLTREQLNSPEVTYPLRLMQCNECSLAQLDYVVDGALVYPADYPYRAGISWPVVEAHKRMAANLHEKFRPGFVVDIGCNDGTLLQQFKALGCRVLGVEPTDVADLSAESGVRTLQAFFGESIGRGIQHFDGKADLITMTNVFAHMANLGDVMRGVSGLLANDGVLVIENHYLLDILEFNQFDSIYHEHIRTYTLKSLQMLFAQYYMEIFHVERVPRYGGNIRAFVGWNGKHRIDESVDKLASTELQMGVGSAGPWEQFRKRVERSRDEFYDYAHTHEIVGCSAPGRASTLLNYYGIKRDVMPWTGELSGSLKIGKYLPGSHIEVVSNQRLHDTEEFDAVVLFAWHYASEIKQRLIRENVRTTLVTPLPHFYQESLQ